MIEVILGAFIGGLVTVILEAVLVYLIVIKDK